MLFYRAALPLSRKTLNYVAGNHPEAPEGDRVAVAEAQPGAGSPARAGLPAQRRDVRGTGSRVRGRQDHGLAVRERAVALLAARAPKLRAAVREAKRAGHAYVILDGTPIPIDRVARDKPFYSGKHKKHGMNLQVIASPGGDILWVSGALPGSVHDKKAEWIWGVLGELERQGLVTLADKGYQGSTWAKVPYKGKNKPEA